MFWLVAIAAVWTGQFIELMTLFALVIIHELGHVFSALSFGWRVREIELLPFGGVAKVDEWGTTSTREEIIVALAGPFMNIVMIIVAYVFFLLGIWEETWSAFFIHGNLVIAVFNLIPAWPLDGGKVVHAVLTHYISFRQSIYIILVWSILVIIGFMIFAYFYSSKLNLLVISLYLLIEIKVAWKRIHYQFIRFLLFKMEQITTKKTHLPHSFIFLQPSDKIGEVVKMIKKGYYHYFHVLDNHQNIVVKLREEQILTLFFENPSLTISECITV